MIDSEVLMQALNLGVSNSNGAFELVKNFREAYKRGDISEREVGDRLSEIYEKLLDTQTSVFAVKQEVDKLRSQLVSLNEFDLKATNYSLTKTPGGALVYALKNSDQTGEPPHFLCPTCYHDRKFSILQPQTAIHHRCNTCGASHLQTGGATPTEPVTRRTGKRVF